MRLTAGLVAALLLSVPSIPFFKYVRTIPPAGSSGQRYIVMDEALWQGALPGLGDLRLYAGTREIPYALDIERGSSETERKPLRVLQPAMVAGRTQFLLEMTGLPEYDRIELRLNTKNFVAHARVSGENDPQGSRWAFLGTTTLYDLSEEKLGHNSTLQIPLTAYRYLRVTIDAAVKPADVLGATAAITHAQKPLWRTILSSGQRVQRGQDTVVTFPVPKNVPVERLSFDVDAAEPNFRREIEVRGNNEQLFGSGEISRIHMVRNGQRVDVEETSPEIRGISQGTVRAIIHNGDDVPLRITGERVEQYERRIYFDAGGGTEYKLYYGDNKLAPPVYDFSKLFQKDPAANEAQLAAQEANPEYAGRPDDRPWSDRHPAVLWAAIIAAVLMLGAIALRAMRFAKAS
jgi:Protein of unknown function (DUF3999)